MATQEPDVLKRFHFLEKTLDLYKSSSYSQLRALVDNPQTIFEQFEGQSMQCLLYALEQKDKSVSILLSEVNDVAGIEQISWYTVCFQVLATGEVLEPSFNKKLHCPFCQQKTHFTTDLPLGKGTIYHCQRCRNFFDPTSLPVKIVGSLFSLIFILISLFVFFTGLVLMTDNIAHGHLFNRFTAAASILILGGAAMTYVLSRKIYTAATTPLIQRVSDLGIHWIVPKNP